MITYILRRCLYAIPIIIGVNLITFVLFFFVNSPDDIARKTLGEKNTTQDDIDTWKRDHSYHLPLLFNNGWSRINLRRLVDGNAILKSKPVQPGMYRFVLTNHAISPLEINLELDCPPGSKLSETQEREFKEEKIGTGQSNPDHSKIGQERMTKRISLAPGKKATLHLKISEYGSVSLKASQLTESQNLEMPKGSKRKDVASIEFMLFENLSNLQKVTETIFFKKAISLFVFDFGKSDRNNYWLSNP